MNSLAKLTLLAIALATTVQTGQICFGQTAKTSVTISVIEIDKRGERPAANMQIYILPKNQGVARGKTNSQGKARFEFTPTESVVFRIGAGGGQLRLEPLSGRFDQSTSYIIDLSLIHI